MARSGRTVNTTAAQDPYAAFNVRFQFDGTLLRFTNSMANFTSGGALEASGGSTFCATFADPVANRGGGGCAILGDATTAVAGTLAYLTLIPVGSSGCARLHLFTYGPPDGGTVTSGTYTVGRVPSLDFPQANTYGPDVYVNAADGSECVPSACISFDPAGCGPTATPTPQPTPTPPGGDAQTATATVLRTSTPAATSSRVAVTATATPGQRRR